MPSFRDTIDALPAPSLPPLLLTHVTDWHRGAPALRSGEIAPPEQCPVYKEFLVYAFYGRAAYVANGSADVIVNQSYAPICFIFRADVAPPARVLPFDTGAMEAGRYAPHIHHTSRRADFEMTPHVDSARRLITHLYGGNNAYFIDRPSDGLAIDPLNTELNAYYQLIRAGVQADERQSAIEFQFASPLTIAGHLEAVFLPNDIAIAPSVKTLLRKLKTKAIPYTLPRSSNPSEFRALLRYHLEKLLRKKGALA